MSFINTNIASIRARSNLERVERAMDQSIERLSSGKRINAARDDASGSAIAGRMESQIRGLASSIRHAKDGQSFAHTAEGGLKEITSLLQRMRELAVQAASGVASTTDKDYLNLEMKQLVAEIAHIDANTKFNDMTVFTSTGRTFYTDIDVAGTAITTPGIEMSTAVTPGFTSTVVSIGGGVVAAKLSSVLSAIDVAVELVDDKRANLGAVSNRFDHIVDNLTNIIANTEAAKSRIEDADFSVETTELTRNQVLQQAATSMVAQANTSKNTILALIQQ